mmetsp:Transcript_13600/g.43441  ORF Transcript_13600/g.43441 Transcript_13600/m.43441 type:complete len:197 (+) Transcript_13600:134-724(+)
MIASQALRALARPARGATRALAARGLSAPAATSGGKHPTVLDLSKFASRDSAEARQQLPQEALNRDIELRKEHFAVRKSFPESAQPKEGPRIDERRAHRKRLVYRSKQRGWLEVDLLLGSFATDNVDSFSDEEAAQYEAILNCETLDIYNMITKQMQVPEILQTPMMTRLQEYAATSPAGKASPTMYEQIKKKMSN